jgi:hypothetical protein
MQIKEVLHMQCYVSIKNHFDVILCCKNHLADAKYPPV